MDAYHNTIRFLNRIASRRVWHRPTDRTSWTPSDADDATPVDVTELVGQLTADGLVAVDQAGTPIGRGPWRGCRWLKLTRAGDRAVADAARREDDALEDGPR